MDRRERKKQVQKQKIVDVAVKLFKEKGFHETAIQDILDGADVSKGTLYNYFPDKEATIIPYFQQIFKDYLASRVQLTDLEENLQDLFAFICQIMEANRGLMAIYFAYRMKCQLNTVAACELNRSGLEKVLYDIIEQAKAKDEINLQLETEFLATSLSLMTFNLLMTAIHLDDFDQVRAMSRQMTHLFLYGVRKGGQTDDGSAHTVF